jgi:uncharacterized membrane protein YbhN (UPF0104 family)
METVENHYRKKVKTDIRMKNGIEKLGSLMASLVGFSIIYLLIRGAGFKNVIATFVNMDAKYLVLGLCFLDIYLYGVILNYASAIQGLGIGAKMGLLKLNQVKVSKSAASISLEIIFDIIFAGSVFIIFTLSYHDLIVTKFGSANRFFVLGLVAGILCIVGAIFLRKIDFFRHFLGHITEAFKMQRALSSFILTALIWLLGALLMYCLVLATGNQINFLIILYATSSAFILGLISFVPGGLGVRDAISAFVLNLSGLELNVSISVSLINRILSIITVLVILMFGIVAKKFLIRNTS